MAKTKMETAEEAKASAVRKQARTKSTKGAKMRDAQGRILKADGTPQKERKVAEKWKQEELLALGDKGKLIGATKTAIRVGVKAGFPGSVWKDYAPTAVNGVSDNLTKKDGGKLLSATPEQIEKLNPLRVAAMTDIVEVKGFTPNVAKFLDEVRAEFTGTGGGGGGGPRDNKKAASMFL